MQVERHPAKAWLVLGHNSFYYLHLRRVEPQSARNVLLEGGCECWIGRINARSELDAHSDRAVDQWLGRR
eukprot:3815143-Prymnesium_polylepis.1